MKNQFEILLISIAIAALPVCSLAKVASGVTVPSAPISSNPVSTGTSTVPNSVTPTIRCINSSVSNVVFAFNTTTNPATYTLSYTCTLSLNGTTQSAVSTNQGGSGSCEPSQSSAACQNAALVGVDNQCSTLCASYR
jgi:hypothetical protein